MLHMRTPAGRGYYSYPNSYGTYMAGLIVYVCNTIPLIGPQNTKSDRSPTPVSIEFPPQKYVSGGEVAKLGKGGLG